MKTKKIHLPEVVGRGYKRFWQFKGRYLVCKGSRASKKSKTTALRFITNMMKYKGANLLVVRKTYRTLKDSCFTELKWAIHRLGVDAWWSIKESPLELTYLPTGQKIYFRGLDDPLKVTSITVDVGQLCWMWIEEAYEVTKESDFDMLDESIRGASEGDLFKQITITFNPWNERHWIKKRFFDKPNDQVLAMTTNYLCNEHLSDTDRQIYERMRVENPRKYEVAGLGNWGVAEGLVYENWTVEGFQICEITKEAPWQWRHVFGLDFGFSNDPTAFLAAAVNPLAKQIYVYDEHSETGMLNSDIVSMIVKKGYQKERVYADGADPKSCAELRKLGLSRVTEAKKGQDSILAGIMNLREYRIVIHPLCRHTAAEIASYAWEKDKLGNALNRPTDKDNHLMDALRYAMQGVEHFRPSEKQPKEMRTSRTAVSAADMRGGWS